ncbi:MAG: SapC family protein [Rhodospirillales bacterium]|nr:SapC family protein [Rhodospirillales bacterium]
MFQNFANLDVDLHKDLKFEPSVNLKFAATTAMAPIAASEMSRSIRQFPVCFSMDDPLVPVAFMSLLPEKNAFVNAAGAWAGDYLPAHIRRFPFILGNTDDPDKFTIMFDSDAPELNTFSGKPLYEDNGEMAPALQEVVAFLQAFQSELAATQALLRPLIEKDVLTVQNITVNRPDGSTWTFDGVRAVDGDRLNALDDATLAEWVRSGLMAIVYGHLHSLENVRYLAEQQGIIAKQD